MLNLALHILGTSFRSRQSLLLENVALRHQLHVLKRRKKRPVLKDRDRLFWILLRRLSPNRRRSLVLVQPETVIRWHRKGFRAYWRRKTRARRSGRPRLTLDERALIQQTASENPLWGAPRIHGELLKLGIEIGEATVSKYMKERKPPSQCWKTFLKNHAAEIVSVDFFTVPTITCQVLYVFLLVHNASRRIVHFNVTANPTAEWTSLQILQAFPWDTAPKYLLRDRDSIYATPFTAQVQAMGIEQVVTSGHRGRIHI